MKKKKKECILRFHLTGWNNSVLDTLENGEKTLIVLVLPYCSEP